METFQWTVNAILTPPVKWSPPRNNKVWDGLRKAAKKDQELARAMERIKDVPNKCAEYEDALESVQCYPIRSLKEQRLLALNTVYTDSLNEFGE